MMELKERGMQLHPLLGNLSLLSVLLTSTFSPCPDAAHTLMI